MANKRTLSDEDIATILSVMNALDDGAGKRTLSDEDLKGAGKRTLSDEDLKGAGKRTLSNKDLEKSYKKGGKVKKYMGGGKVYASHNKRYSHGGKVSGRKATYKY
jgi:hypothetical protein